MAKTKKCHVFDTTSFGLKRNFEVRNEMIDGWNYDMYEAFIF